MKALKLTTIALTASTLLLGTASLAFASGTSNCEVVYGGGEVCPTNTSFTIDKLVQVPSKGGQYVDNLTVNDPMFNASQDVSYQIKVKNTGSSKISKVVVTDTLPASLTYVGGGSYDANSKTVKFEAKDLETGKEAVYLLTAKVKDAKNLNTTNPECVTNSVVAVDDKGSKAEDTANLCITKSGPKVEASIPTKTIPNTGPEALALFLLPPLGAAGLYLRRKAGL